MTIPFITSKIGKLEQIIFYKYEFGIELLNSKIQYEKFIYWLKKNNNIFVYRITKKGFETLEELSEIESWQYKFAGKIKIKAPFNNTQQISNCLSFILRKSFSIKYDQFLNTNNFKIESVLIDPFVLNKCLSFNVEIFKNGKFYIHFLPNTKITNEPYDVINSIELIDQFKTKIDSQIKDVEFHVVELNNFKKRKINLFNENEIQKARNFISDHDKHLLTFNYHFVSSYSSDIFGRLVENTIKDLDQSIFFTESVINGIAFPDFFNVQTRPFLRFEKVNVSAMNNLIVGNNQFVNQQSAAYHNGIYRKANNSIIQPILIDNYPDISLFNRLIFRFNLNSDNFELKDPIIISSNQPKAFDEIIKNIKSTVKRNYLLAIFSMYTQPDEVILPLKLNKIKYQIYLGSLEQFKLSNFVVKCLEKNGGLLSIIKDSGVNDNTYFVGIDLGHFRSPNENFTNIAMTFFNHSGELIYKRVAKGLLLNEAFSSESISECLKLFREYLNKKKLKLPSKIIFHRDGRLHLNDENCLTEKTFENLNVTDVEIVEIVKSGYPIMAEFEDGAYINLKSGNAFIDSENKYAILITNMQADEINALINPIIIKHKYGSSPMIDIIKQVYWFTKVYTNNLYNSTRLPATTLKANNIVGTSLKNHRPTYLG